LLKLGPDKSYDATVIRLVAGFFDRSGSASRERTVSGSARTCGLDSSQRPLGDRVHARKGQINIVIDLACVVPAGCRDGAKWRWVKTNGRIPMAGS